MPKGCAGFVGNVSDHPGRAGGERRAGAHDAADLGWRRGSFDYDALPLLPRLFFWVNVWVMAINLWPFQPKAASA
jgi:hypothetical protein